MDIEFPKLCTRPRSSSLLCFSLCSLSLSAISAGFGASLDRGEIRGHLGDRSSKRIRYPMTRSRLQGHVDSLDRLVTLCLPCESSQDTRIRSISMYQDCSGCTREVDIAGRTECASNGPVRYRNLLPPNQSCCCALSRNLMPILSQIRWLDGRAGRHTSTCQRVNRRSCRHFLSMILHRSTKLFLRVTFRSAAKVNPLADSAIKRGASVHGADSYQEAV